MARQSVWVLAHSLVAFQVSKPIGFGLSFCYTPCVVRLVSFACFLFGFSFFVLPHFQLDESSRLNSFSS